MLPAGEEVEQQFHLILVISRQHRWCIIPQAVKTVLLGMGEIIARNTLS